MFSLSKGAPNVAAVAHENAGRVARVAIISGVAPPAMSRRFRGTWPPVRRIFSFARGFPWMNRRVLRKMGAFYANKELMLKQMIRALPEPTVYKAASTERDALNGVACQRYLR